MATFKVSTKVNKDSKPIETTLTLIEDDEETKTALARQCAVIRWQAWARKNGIPQTATVKYSELKVGLKSEAMTAESIAAKAKSDPAFRAKVLASLGQK